MKKSQLELPLERKREPDRNLHKGGRSFYFFDFDDNVAFLATPMFLFHKSTKAEIRISSREFAHNSGLIGQSGPFAEYELDYEPLRGSFRCFRDKNFGWWDRVTGKRQAFVEDLAATLTLSDTQWKGPSWECFYHAVFNSRPVALITARGHHPDTVKDGIRLWVKEGHLPKEPNYLSVFPVSHPETKLGLQMPDTDSIPHLKQMALRAAVTRAIEVYGPSPHHRFGMSDDDPRNIEWITMEMKLLKKQYPAMSFFIIQVQGDQMIKSQVFADRVEEQLVPPEDQLSLFDE